MKDLSLPESLEPNTSKNSIAENSIDLNSSELIFPTVGQISNMETQTELSQLSNDSQAKLSNANTQTEVMANSLLLVTDELLRNQWLTDLTIQPYFQMLSDRFLGKKLGIIINPLVVHAVKNTDDFEFLLIPLNIMDMNYIIFPINILQAFQNLTVARTGVL